MTTSTSLGRAPLLIALLAATQLCSCSVLGQAPTGATTAQTSSPDFYSLSGWIIGIVGIILAVVFGAIQVKSYRDQKRLETAYNAVFEKAQLEWQGKYTEDQIKDLNMQLDSLKAQIQSHIPIQARRVFLQDRAATLQETITNLYVEYERIKAELGPISITELDTTIKRAIEDEISPAYIKQRNQQRLIYLMVLGILVATLLPLFTNIFWFLDSQESQYVLYNIVPVFLLFVITWSGIPSIFRRHKGLTLALALLMLVIWASFVILILLFQFSRIPGISYQFVYWGSFLAPVPLALAVRGLYACFFEWRRSTGQK